MQAKIQPIDFSTATYTVELPAGYYRVWRGTLIDGDLCLDREAFLAGEIRWMPVKSEFLGRNPRKSYCGPQWYTLLIRQGTPVDSECERCELQPARTGERFCRDCRRAVIDSLS